MAFIGIVGARKFKDRKAVEDLVISLPRDSIVVTSGCDGVCKWAQEKAKEHGMRMAVSGDEAHIRVMEAMKAGMNDPEKMKEWMERKKAEFDALPDDE